jgi:hypothetical protein
MSNYSAIIFPPIIAVADPNPDSLSEPPPYNEVFLDDNDLPSYEAVTVPGTSTSLASQHSTDESK